MSRRPPLTLERYSVDQIECIAARGEVDIATAPELTVVLRRVLDEGARMILLDLTDVTYVDSMGICAVYRGHVESLRRDARFVCIHGRQLDRFVWMGLGRALSLVDSRAKALAELHGESSGPVAAG